ncbi:YgfZ/GcvT domain-containing protein [Endozoicomonas lisbonensis]|uniref:Folate-binding protein YgfZ n=1 Tax=Endozoicomonas lisbonensis TaxID=3120522 RepID=A0ABV2SM79_9GAMM
MSNNHASLFAPFLEQVRHASFADRHQPAMSLLTDRGFLSVSGPDSQRFLQGQLSNNLNVLEPGQHHLSTACTPKGRMYSAFRLLHCENAFLLSMHKGLLDLTQTTLGKYAVFFKSEQTIDTSLVALGLSGSSIKNVIETLFGNTPEDGSAIKVEQSAWLLAVPGTCERYELWLPANQLSAWWEKMKQNFLPVSQSHWRLLDIEAVIPELLPEATEQYIPQHLNLPTLNAVSFRKGCYTGQEIVARMQNLGQLKSRCYHLTADSAVELSPNTKLTNAAGKTIGEVLYAVTPTDAKQTELLAVIRVEAAETSDVQLPDNDITFTVSPLPYHIDVKAELQR